LASQPLKSQRLIKEIMDEVDIFFLMFVPCFLIVTIACCWHNQKKEKLEQQEKSRQKHHISYKQELQHIETKVEKHEQLIRQLSRENIEFSREKIEISPIHE
jgi:septin family protein